MKNVLKKIGSLFVTILLVATLFSPQLYAQSRSPSGGSSTPRIDSSTSTQNLADHLFDSTKIDFRVFSELRDRLSSESRAKLREISNRGLGEQLPDVVGQTALDFDTPNYEFADLPNVVITRSLPIAAMRQLLNRDLPEPTIIVDTLSSSDTAILNGVTTYQTGLSLSRITDVMQRNPEAFVVVYGHTAGDEAVLSSHSNDESLDWNELQGSLSLEDRDRLILYSCRSACLTGVVAGVSNSFDSAFGQLALNRVKQAKTVGELFASFADDENRFYISDRFRYGQLLGRIGKSPEPNDENDVALIYIGAGIMNASSCDDDIETCRANLGSLESSFFNDGQDSPDHMYQLSIDDTSCWRLVGEISDETGHTLVSSRNVCSEQEALNNFMAGACSTAILNRTLKNSEYVPLQIPGVTNYSLPLRTTNGWSDFQIRCARVFQILVLNGASNDPQHVDRSMPSNIGLLVTLSVVLYVPFVLSRIASLVVGRDSDYWPIISIIRYGSFYGAILSFPPFGIWIIFVAMPFMWLEERL